SAPKAPGRRLTRNSRSLPPVTQGGGSCKDRPVLAAGAVLLRPEDYDFISNFSTLEAVFIGAILATIGGFAATQLEWYFERKRRERNAALFFGEVLSTLAMLMRLARH